MKSPNQTEPKILRAKLKPLVAAMLPLMALGMHTPVLAAVIDYADGEEKTDAITLTDNSTELQVNTGSATQSGVISGAFNINKNGVGSLTLSGANTYSGTTNIAQGTVVLGNADALGSSSSIVVQNGSGNVITGNAKLDLGGFTIFTGQLLSNSIAGGVDNGTINVSSSIIVGRAAISGVLAGTASLSKEQGETTTLSAANTYTGATNVNGGKLSVSSTGSILNTSAITINGGNLEVNGAGGNAIADTLAITNTSGTFTLTGSDETIGSIAGAGNINLNNNTLTTGGDGTSTTVSGIISGAGGGLTKQGAGTLTLSGANTYTGATTINAGTVDVANASALGNSSAVTVGGGTLNLTTDLSIGSLAGSGNTTLNANTLTTGGNDTSTTYSGVLSGTGALVKQGTGTTTLSGNNTYSGTTTVNAGTLSVSSDSNLGGGALTLNGGNLAVTGTTTIDNDITLSDDATITNSANATLSGVISGAGNLTKTGASTLTLSGANTYTGDTTIDAGTLQVANASALGNNSAVTVNGGNLDLTTDLSIGSLAGAGNVTLNANTLTTGGDDSSTTYSGVLSGTGALTKQGTGTTILSGTNTYSGGTTVNSGTLQGTTDSLQGNITNNANVTFDQTTNGTYADVMSGTGSLTKSNSGTLTLSGTNTYTGGTTINDGTISIGAAANLGSGGLTLDGGTLQTTASFTSSRGTTLGASGGSFNIDAGTTLTQSGNISGSGSLTKTGEGTLILSGSNNSFTGGTVVADGRLIALDSDAIAKAGNITNNAIVEFQIGLNASAYHYDQISGTGSLIKSGAGNVVLNGNNTYTGGTTISEGILSIGGTAGSITGDILNNGELRFLRTNDYTFAGDISGTGSVSNYLSGTTTLTGNNTYSGITYIRDGILQIGDGGTSGTLGTGNVTNNSALVFNRSDDSGYAGVISGTGAVSKEGAGNFNLTGTNTYTGATTVNAGILSVNGSISNSTTTVNSGGTLGGTGTVGDVFINGGTFAPGNSIGTINVSGDVDFSGGGNYDVEVDAAGNNDKIVATGSATLTSGIVNVKAAPGTYAYATDYTILTASGGLGGTTFDSVNANLAFLTPTLSYDVNNVFLKLTRNDVSFNDVASTPNQQAVARALDSNINGLSSLVSQITPLSSLAARQAFDSLSGVQHSNNQLISRTVSSQFNKLLLNHGSQSTSGSLAFNAPSPNATGYNSGSAFPLIQARGWWIQGFGSFNKIDDTNNARGADYQTTGLAMGFDVDWNDFVIGVAGSYARTDVDPYSGNSTIDSYMVATYGSWQQDQLYVNASVGLGLHKVDASRTVIMGSSVSNAKADYDSFDVNSTIETGKDFALGADTTLTPFAGISYLYNTRDSFTEKGADAANLKVHKENDESLLTSIGLRLSHNIPMADNRILRPTASIAYVHEHMDSVSRLDANFKNVSGSNFSIDGPELDRDRFQLAIGVTGQLTGSTSLVLGYYGEFADSHQNNALTARVNVNF